MIGRLSKFASPLAVGFFLSGCASYTISTGSFERQTRAVTFRSLVPIQVQRPILGTQAYLANRIDSIECLDGNGNQVAIRNGPTVELKIVERNGRETVMYFDSIYRSDSLVIGSSSRQVTAKEDTVNLRDIQEIRIQAGGRNRRSLD